ncbi:hypothetical protein BZG36_01452 [Bifiguratus adelaidae]|uniref:Nop domain-containing protein n=1 Tax=Bifiguratus adelaidae TaxID=1938954 RepID=A0A261Y5G3_9FUNG|nr:hypothetical protein BZG36_01452 [Bifiguratus adelaidae]
MSLADELAADLELEDEEEEEQHEQNDIEASGTTVEDTMDGEEDEDEDMEDEHERERKRVEQIAMREFKNVHKIAKLMTSKTMQDVLTDIEKYKNTSRDWSRMGGPTEEDPEYQLIVKANALTVDIDNEILIVHKFIRDHYSAKLPELESLVPNALEYARAVKAIGTEIDISKVDLRSILPPGIVMAVTLTGTTTKGQPLSAEEWKITEDACDLALSLDEARRTIVDYVQSRMMYIAPNLSKIVGSNVAAKLCAAAGGVTGLSKMPACNVQVLGSSRKGNAGFSTVSLYRHAGYIFQADLVVSAPQDIRMKVQRVIAPKLVLAARIDRAHESMDGSAGQRMREEIEKKIDKMQEAAPQRNVKALPVPDEAPKKRRGGRRARKQKEAYALTELRKAQNRMAFGVEEDETGSFDTTKGMGLVGLNSGKIRAAAADPRVKVKAPKQTQKSFGSSGTTSGLASSLAFTPVQGIELVDPTAAAERVKKANERWFGSGGFAKPAPKTG